MLGGAVALAGATLLALGKMAADAFTCGAVLAQSAFGLWGAGWFYWGFWRHRAAYRQRYGDLAYRHLCFRFLLPALIGAGPTVYFPILVGGERLLAQWLAYSCAAYLLLTTGLIETRGKEIFWSWDVRGFVYSVFPERGRVLTSGIFHRLRHPVYSAGMRWVCALALLRDNMPALLCAFVVALGFCLLARLEERELVQLDASYSAYRRRVPAFFVARPLPFWHYLLTGNRTG